MVAPAESIGARDTLMGDRIVLTIPADPDSEVSRRSSLVVSGARADLPYERTDDLQLAVLSALDAPARTS